MEFKNFCIAIFISILDLIGIWLEKWMYTDIDIDIQNVWKCIFIFYYFNVYWNEKEKYRSILLIKSILN